MGLVFDTLFASEVGASCRCLGGCRVRGGSFSYPPLAIRLNWSSNVSDCSVLNASLGILSRSRMIWVKESSTSTGDGDSEREEFE